MVLRQIGSCQDLFTIEIRYRNLSCRNQIIFGIPQLEEILFELGKLSGAVQAVLIDDIRGQHLLIVMFPAVKIHHEIDKCTFKTCSQPLVKNKT
ncbi:hypothetical protein D3C81_1356910 [compost metagenome]